MITVHLMSETENILIMNATSESSFLSSMAVSTDESIINKEPKEHENIWQWAAARDLWMRAPPVVIIVGKGAPNRLL